MVFNMTKSLIIHGGAGAWRISALVERAIEAIRKCTEQAWRVLSEHNNSLDAVIEAVVCMENSGYFNAGYGSTLNLLGERELDAGLMTSTGLLGAVAAVKSTRNPILLARIIAEKTPHILVAGENADKLALLYNLPPLPPPPQHVVERYRDVLKKLVREEITDSYYKSLSSLIRGGVFFKLINDILNVYDTVGAVAVDDNSVLATATSTGGVLLKLPGRVGDTPIPGAGFYADKNIACSATGIGEYIIRTMPCLRLSLEYEKQNDAEKALNSVVDYVNRTAGSNTMGFISVDKTGKILYAYNTEAMLISYVYRGEVKVFLKPEPRVNVITLS
jgi:beta-aspartyl-peptidase (threonine type)